jgi:hypothetical protein
MHKLAVTSVSHHHRGLELRQLSRSLGFASVCIPCVVPPLVAVRLFHQLVPSEKRLSAMCQALECEDTYT